MDSDMAKLFHTSLIICFLANIIAIHASAAQKQSETQNTDMEHQNNEESVSVTAATGQITGFYGGADIGLDMSKLKLNNTVTHTTAKKRKSGLLLDVFTGYNCQLGNFICGVEGFLDFKTTKNSAKVDTKTVNSRRKYEFGLAPKVGYNIYDDLNGYANIGLLLSKYKVRSTDGNSNPLKTLFFAGIGLEQSFGTLFVRGELNKIFKKTITNVGGVKTSTDSYVFKIGGGYRF
jgi:hypothetical protein